MKEIVCTFGRYQPVTKGHEIVVNRMRELAKGDPFFIFTSHTTGNKNNPLDYLQKLFYLNAAFPDAWVIKADLIKNPFDMLSWLLQFDSPIQLVCGQDRAASYHKMIRAWFVGKVSLQVVGTERAFSPFSATVARSCVESLDFAQFCLTIPDTLNSRVKWELYIQVMKRLDEVKNIQRVSTEPKVAISPK